MAFRFPSSGTCVCLLGLLGAFLSGCDSDAFPSSPEEATGFSRAYGVWNPTVHDTCTREIHDSYSVVGPDGKLYPTWHPPVDPASGCTFGHEHGRDPRGSDLYGEVGDLPFALANEALDDWEFAMSRHEDHFGHKVEWENDIQLNVGAGASSIIDITCDVLVKMHQGSHSKDAFTNNVHELSYHLRCSDGVRFHITLMVPIGTPGELVSTCTGNHIHVGNASPPDSPEGGGKRRIPDRACIEDRILVGEGQNSNFSGLRESWETSGRIRTAEGRTLVSVNPYFQVFNPSRYYDPTMPDNVGRPVDLCVEGDGAGRLARGELCNGASLALGYDDPHSQFSGAHRMVDINANRVTNEGGIEVWYTDPFGRNGSPEPFPGSIRQFVSASDNSAFDTHGPNIGKNRNYGGNGVHAPN